jgi:hypothetical protein
MFSVLICSINKTYLENIKINVAQTIGCKYEIIVWDNSIEPKPITEVYNILASKAQYPYWCFVHEDVSFHTQNWSEYLLKAFSSNFSLGLIGIAGSKYKSRTPSGWSTGILKYDYCNIFHLDKTGQKQHFFNNPTQSQIEPVVNIDGVFMVIRRDVWRDAVFNAQLLRGFHLYDIDFSFQVSKKWASAVIFSIDIVHYTQGGDFGDAWVAYTLMWHKKFKNDLPVSILAQKPVQSVEGKITNNWLNRLSTENISWKNKWKWIKATKALYRPASWPYIGLFLGRKIFK